MPNYKGTITLFEHDSDCCEYLGVHVIDEGPYEGKYDLYVCVVGGFGRSTLIARYSGDGPDYYSGTVFATGNRNLALYEAGRRAIALEWITQGEIDREVNYNKSSYARFDSAGTIENGEITSYVEFGYEDVLGDSLEDW